MSVINHQLTAQSTILDFLKLGGALVFPTGQILQGDTSKGNIDIYGELHVNSMMISTNNHCGFYNLDEKGLDAALNDDEFAIDEVVSNLDVHASHCCIDHGCQYGDEQCPVATGKIAQLYPCIDCSDDISSADFQSRHDAFLNKQKEGADLVRVLTTDQSSFLESLNTERHDDEHLWCECQPDEIKSATTLMAMGLVEIEGNTNDIALENRNFFARVTRDYKEKLEQLKLNSIPFDKLALGVRFTYVGNDKVWIKLSNEGCGLIAEYNRQLMMDEWVGQQICSAKEFADEVLLVVFIG